MKTSNILLAAALGTLASGAFAVEATQYNPQQGGLSRAEIRAEAAEAARTGSVLQYGEATVFVDKVSNTPRALARAEAAAEGPVRVVRLGEATEFVDGAGVRSRAEVRAETLAAVSAARGK